MLQRTLLAIGLVALLVQGAVAHTYLSTVTLDGQQLSEGDCVRPHPSTAFDSPIPFVTSPDMTCGHLPQAAQRANRACPIQAGSSIGITWHHNNNGPDDNIVDPTHVGPILYYLAKSSDGAGAVWFKIYEDGYDPNTKKWATDKMIANRGKTTVTIPADIAPGNYLLRGEIFALHNGYMLDGVQPYVGCVELTISGSGTANPSGVSFPGYYKNTDPGFNVDVYQTIKVPYAIPGPALYKSGSAPSTGSSGTTPSTPAPTPSTPAPTPSTPAPTPSTPAPTQPTPAPSASSSSGSSGGGGSLKVSVNPGSNTWWVGVIVSGGSERTTAVEIKDSGSVSSWSPLQQMPYAWVFSRSVQVTLPISVRLTSESGKQVTYDNLLTAWDQATPSGNSDYGSSSNTRPPPSPPAPTITPATPAPNQNNNNNNNNNQNNNNNNNNIGQAGSPRLTVYPSANQWWFAVTLSDTSNIASVEVKDSGVVSNYAFMTSASWGYSLPATGTPFVPPLTVRVTYESGRSVTATIPAIEAGASTQAQ